MGHTSKKQDFMCNSGFIEPLTLYHCSYSFSFTDIVIDMVNGIEIFKVVKGRTYNNNYYCHTEFV